MRPRGGRTHDPMDTAGHGRTHRRPKGTKSGQTGRPFGVVRWSWPYNIVFAGSGSMSSCLISPTTSSRNMYRMTPSESSHLPCRFTWRHLVPPASSPISNTPQRRCRRPSPRRQRAQLPKVVWDGWVMDATAGATRAAMGDLRCEVTRAALLHWGGGGELPRWQGFGGGGAIHWLCGIVKENLRHARTSPLPCCLQEIEAQDVVSLVVGAMLRAGEARQR